MAETLRRLRAQRAMRSVIYRAACIYARRAAEQVVDYLYDVLRGYRFRTPATCRHRINDAADQGQQPANGGGGGGGGGGG